MKPEHKAVLLDTSFLIHFLNDNDPLFGNADGYFRCFIQNEINMLVSTISIAEYCVGGDVHELPLRNLQILPFNLNHSRRAGEFAKVVYQARKDGRLQVRQRLQVPNDSKLFAQADCEHSVDFYLSSDEDSLKVFNILRSECSAKFQFINLKIPYTQVFGLLDFTK
jgi:hypothetical protein